MKLTLKSLHSEMKESFDQVNGRIDEVNGRFDGLSRQLDKHIRGTNERFDQVNARIDERFGQPDDKIERVIVLISNYATIIEGRLSNHDQRIIALEKHTWF